MTTDIKSITDDLAQYDHDTAEYCDETINKFAENNEEISDLEIKLRLLKSNMEAYWVDITVELTSRETDIEDLTAEIIQLDKITDEFWNEVIPDMANKIEKLAEIHEKYKALLENTQRLTLQQIESSSNPQTQHTLTSCDNMVSIHEKKSIQIDDKDD